MCIRDSTVSPFEVTNIKLFIEASSTTPKIVFSSSVGDVYKRQELGQIFINIQTFYQQNKE